MNDLSKNIAQLSPEKRQLLEKVLRRQGVDLARSVILPRERNPSGDPLSHAQQRLWFLDRLAPGSSFYNVSQAIRLRSEINPGALGRTFTEIVRRHEMLRTHFGIRQGEPVQLVAPVGPNVLAQVDLRGLPPARREAEMRQLISREARRPFDLATGPLFRALAMQLDREEHVVFLGMHHIISDAWSLEVLIREIVTLYAAFAASRPSPLPELPIQYADFAIWQRQWLKDELLERQLSYWRRQLSDIAVLDLLTDRPRPAVQTFAGASITLEVAGESLVRDLQGIARRSGATLFMLTLAASQALLGRYSGQSDIAVGTPISGRHQVQLEGLIGFFINSLVMRTDLGGNPDFPGLLERVREVTLAAYAHQDVPFEMLVAHLQPERDQSRSPLFQVIFGLQTASSAAPAAIQEVRFEPIQFEVGRARFDLTLSLGETAKGLFCSAEYNCDLFDRPTIQRLLRHFRALLRQVAAEPARPVGELDLLSASERHQLLAEWNDTGAGQFSFLHELIAGWAARTPEAVAIDFGERRMTYRDLDGRANQLARHLASLGVGRGVAVGLCFERSPEMVVALLGVLKAGGSYLPLDPTYPQERLAFMMEDCGLLVQLTQESLEDALPQSWGFTIRLDADWDAIAHQSAEPLPLVLHPDDLAYVIYTSGSTGRPKGVMVSHHGLGNLAREQAEIFRVGPGSQVLQFASLSFDASIWEIAMALGSGATLHLAHREALLPGPELLELLRARRITTVTLPPVALAGLPATDLPDLHTLVVAGEACALDVARRWGAGRRLINAYGPTEATVCATYGVFTSNWNRLPIGRPIAGAQVHLLDSELHLVPTGVKGELYLGGVGLARGYWGRPDLTAAAFVPNPFSAEPGARLYRTGDLGRLLADGDIELFGRVDSQIKLRGFRIELGEIEAALGRHPDVREAAVLLREDHSGERRIAAYLVPQRAEVTVEELRGALEEQLPPHMVPTFFVLLDALPRLPNDKVDRRSLPAPEGQSFAADDSYAAPRNRTEKVLAEIWCQLLRLERVGVHQNFFEAGGDSILGMQVIFRAGEAGLHLTPGQLFDHPTIAGLAAVAETAEKIVLETGPVVGPVPLTPIQHWFFEQELPHPEHFNQSLLFEAGIRVEPALLFQALEALLSHHDALRMRFVPPAEGRGSWQQHNEPTGAPAPGIQVDLSSLPEEHQGPAIERFAAQLQTSLNLEAGPLLRVALFTASGGPDTLFLIVHHLVVDGVSWRVLLADLEEVYNQLSRGEEPALPARTTSFQRWAERVLELARSPGPAAEAGFWLSRAGLEVPSLPVDRSTGGNTVSSAHSVFVALGAEETQALLQEVPKAYRTRINDVLLTALAQTLAPWMGGRRVLLDLEGHGREEIVPDVDVSRTVGFFTSLFPVLLDLTETASPGEALKRVKEQLQDIPGRGLGYGLLRYLGSEEVRASFRRLPRAEVVFNYLGQLDQAVAGSSLFRPSRWSSGEARNPLQPRPYLLEISASVRGGRLVLVWMYSENRHARSTIEALSGRFLEALQRLIDHCLSLQAGGYTPSDFPLARLDQRQLDRLVEAAGGRIEDLYPLSPMQQGLLFQTLQDPGSGVYVGQLGLDVNVHLDAEAFERAWNQLFQRHPILRTGFYWRELKTPLQAVFSRVSLPWERQDWRDLPEGVQRARLKEYLQEDRRRGFDLSAPPLLRLALFRLGEESYRLVFSSHHLIFDGWSWAILLRELFTLYGAGLRGAEAELGAAGSYRNYIAWLAAQEVTEAESFWRRALAGFTAPTSLLLGGRLRTATPPERPFGKALAQLPVATTEALRSLARRQHVTLNTLVQGVWSLLLHHYSGSDDVLFGAVTAGRSAPVPGIETMIGLFINTLPVRVRVAGRAELPGWLRTLQEQQAEARRFEHSPLFEVHGWSEVPRGQSLFESLLTFENYPMDESVQEQVGQSLRPARVEFVDQTNYPLTVIAGARARLDLQIIYDARLFEADAVARMAQHLRSMLEGMLASPDGAIGDLPLLSPGERQQALVEWSTPQAPAGGDESFLHLFAAQAARTPDALAVTFGDRSLTYAELDARSSQLARYLSRRGVGPDVPVGLAVERSLEAIVGLLGILKAGGGYVPLDPTYPAERLAFMMADCGMLVILTQESLVDTLPQSWGFTILLDADWETLASEPEPCELAVTPDNLAYVIYTSGSTGHPKGVMVSHRGLGNLARAQARLFRVGSGSHVLQFASLSFDASIWEVVMALSWGATLHLASREALLSGPELLRLLREREITTVTLPPAVLPGLPAEEIPALQTLIVAGESCDPAMAERWRVGRRLVNAYGPTEATVCVTAADVDGGLDRLPIGRPIRGMQIYLLDRELAPAPVGVRGDIYVGGLGLARGYWGRADLTAAAFLPHPFAEEPGARLYRTGDLGLYLPDGSIEFLGRADAQIKLRGFRIELEEIEAALRSCPGVRDAAAAVQATPDGSLLAAWIVPDEGAAPTAAELRQSLRGKLPEYMIPAHFMSIDRLPLTPNGKLDRRALPRRMAATRISEPSITAPHTPMEELLAGIWEEVLGVERVGREDNFFDLGGHSLLATRVASRVLSVLGVELPLNDLFEQPTLALLAASLADRWQAGSGVPSPPIGRADRSRPLSLSFAQQRLWFLDQLEPDSNSYSIPVHVRLLGHLDVPAFAAALDEIARRHEVLRTTFVLAGDQPVQVIGAARRTLPPLVDLGGLPEGEREVEAVRLSVRDVLRPFDLAAGPLLRLCLLRLGEGDHVVLANMHHIVSDGWSAGILFRELGLLYAAFRAGRPSPLPELTVQYADFAAWQREWLGGGALEQQLAWWREHLAGAPAVLALPTDRPRPALPSQGGDSVTVRLAAGLEPALAALGRREGVTLFMALLGLFQALLGRLSGSEDLVVGSPIAGRSRAELEPLIGFFVNTLVLRLRLAGDPSVRELLGSVKEGALGAYANQDLPFEQLVEELAPERDLGRTPLFQVMFAYQSTPTPRGEADLPGLELQGVPLAARTAKFDLELTLSTAGGELVAVAEYRPDLFDRLTIVRLLRCYEALLAGAVADAERPLSELPLMAESERHQMLQEWNDVPADAPPGLSFQDLFAAQVARAPEAVAAACEGRELTYFELSRRAGSVAASLVQQGAGPGVLVALLAERGLDLLASLLGVLKAGAAYLPLDPRHPVRRHAQVLQQSAASVVLATKELLPAVEEALTLMPPGSHRPRHLCAIEELGGHDEAAPPMRSSSGDLAYVLYTSGSTGIPKGAMIEQRGMVNHLFAKIRALGLSGSDRMAQTAPQTFDISVWQMLAPLVTGGRVEIFSDDVVQSPARLLAAIVQGRITILETVPSLLRLLLEEAVRGAERADLQTLRWMIPTGEALPPDLCREWLRRYPEIPLLNAYGPTECSDDVTHGEIREWREPWARVPIGRPVPRLRLYVAHPLLQALPIGAVGELFVGGAGVGRGYFGEPGRTAEAFVPDPFGGEAGARLYRTGDLARQLPDGMFDFLGRIDPQVKVRGFRIELGEIESVLLQHPDLRDVAVVVREDRPGDRRLTAYVVGAGQPPASEELRRFLVERLPEYMIPATFVPLDALPLTPNGKLDRKALPAPARPSGELADLVAARDAVELELISAFQTVLGIQPIGIRDHFFDLGGHSLLAVRLIAVLRDRFQQSVPLAAVFQQGSVEGLAQLLRDERQAVVPESPLVTLRAGGDLPALYLTHPAGGGLAGYRRLVEHLGPAHPVHGFRARGIATDDEPRTSIEEMAAFYVESLRRFQPSGPYHLSGMSLGALIAFEMARKLREQGEDVALLALIDPPAPRLEIPAELREPDDVSILAIFAYEANLVIDPEQLRPLGAEERLLSLAGQAVEAGLLSAGAGLETTVEYLRRTLKVFKGAEIAAQRYVPGHYDGPVAVLCATESAHGEPQPEDDRGWGRLCSEPITVYSIPGNHNTVLREPNVRQVAELLHQILVQADARRESAAKLLTLR